MRIKPKKYTFRLFVHFLTLIILTFPRFDVGQIVAQREIEILHRITAQDLKRMMAPVGARLVRFSRFSCLVIIAYFSVALGMHRKPRPVSSCGS